MAIEGLGKGANRLAQAILSQRVAELNTLLMNLAKEMAESPSERAAALRSEMEQTTAILEQVNKAMESLFKADKAGMGQQ
jgi:hypothetical protein